MIRLWLFALVAGVLLGSATPPPRLCYDVRGLGADASIPPLAYDLGGLGERLTALLSGAPSPPPPLPRPEVGMRLVVSLPMQKVYVFSDGDLLTSSPVSTGKPGHATPVGTFRILEKQVTHHSNRYSNAPMPFMQRITTAGVALHAGRLPGYPASHGCIRLPWGFAKKLYAMTDRATIVTVTRARPKSAEDALKLI